MNRKQPPWEDEAGVKVLRLYRSKEHPDWPQDVNKAHLQPDWPQVVLLDLTAEQFSEFDKDPMAFANKYKLFPKPIKWTSYCAKPPIGKGIPGPSSNYLAVMIHDKTSAMVPAACPQTTK